MQFIIIKIEMIYIEYIRRKTRLGTDHLNISAVISD